MRLNTRALALTFALIWGGAILLTGVANLIWPGYGLAFLDMLASVYPGYHAEAALGDVVVGTLYGMLDGFVCGLIFGWVYNLLVGRSSEQ